MDLASSDRSKAVEIHCERCGSRAIAGVAGIQFCIECGLYVCPECWWASRNRCWTCAEAASPWRGWESSLATARRADRRLREVSIEATSLADAVASSRSEAAWSDYACLAIKAAAAEYAGTDALGRLSAPEAARTRPLADRLQLHAQVASARLHQAAELVRGEAGQASISVPASESTLESVVHSLRGAKVPNRGARQEPTRWRRYAPQAAGVAAISILAAVVLASNGFEQVPPAGGVLGGTPRAVDRDAGPTTTGPSQGIGPTPAPVPTAVAGRIAFDFDTVRMGEGIGEGWLQPQGLGAGVAVAAFPTAVDRSARLVVNADGNPLTCRQVDPPLAATSRFSLGVILDALKPANAMIELRDAAGNPYLRLNLAVSRSALWSRGETVAQAEGLEPGQWYGIDIVMDDGGVLRVLPLDGASGSGAAVPVARPLVGAVGEICLGANGPLDSAVNYDNLVLTNQ